MNIVTIFDYNIEDHNYKTMLNMFVGGILENCKTRNYNIYIITDHINQIDQMFQDNKIKTIKLQKNNLQVPKNMGNIKNKLYNLCLLNFEYIFLDCDMYVASDLNFLWEKRKDKPFISTIHQKNIDGIAHKNHVLEYNNFMNSGLQIVSDPKFLNFDLLLSFAQKRNFRFPVPGADQALLDTYFKEEINYNYSHENICCDWNSCAGYGKITIDEDYNFNITYINDKDSEYPVKINHYWNEFKPWNIKCPIFNFYRNF
jgi:hypothetical protein